jgi:hypothetical protein
VFIGMGILLLAAVGWGMWSYAGDWQNVYPELRQEYWTNALAAGGELTRGLALSFFQVAALTGVVTALCVRAPVVVSATTAVVLFVAGNFVSALDRAGAASGTILAKAGAFTAGLLIPDQGAMAYSPEAAISTTTVPLAVIGWAGLYALGFALAGMLVGVVLFRNREVL